MSPHTLGMVLEEIEQTMPRMQRWVALMSQYRKGPMRAIYTPQYMATRQRHIRMVHMYPYKDRMDFRGDLELPIPFPAQLWGLQGTSFLLFYMCVFIYVWYI